MVEISRYDPRKDKDALKELFDDFITNKSYYESLWESFEDVLNKRAKDLQFRNSMVIAKEGDNIVGWGTFSVFKWRATQSRRIASAWDFNLYYLRS